MTEMLLEALREARNFIVHEMPSTGRDVVAMIDASLSAQLWLPPILQDYVDDLVKEGTYGDSKSEVMRRFVDEGIRKALNEGRIAKRDPADSNHMWSSLAAPSKSSDGGQV